MSPSHGRGDTGTRSLGTARSAIAGCSRPPLTPMVVGVDPDSGCERDRLSAHDEAIMGVVARLRANDEAIPLAALVRNGGEGRDQVREALEVLGELDPRLLVQVTIDALARAQIDGPGAAIEG